MRVSGEKDIPIRCYANWAATSPVKLCASVAPLPLVRSFIDDDSGSDLRDALRAAFGGEDIPHVIFGASATDLLNKIILGYWEDRSTGTIISSIWEHNSTLRPLSYLKARRGINAILLKPNERGEITPHAFESSLTADTKLAIFSHASNVTGQIQPIEGLSHVAQKHGIPIVIDCAQTAGQIPFDATKLGVDALVMSGHKSLMGPSGLGFAFLSEPFAKMISPVFSGGTGVKSDAKYQPDEMPWKLECGTPHYEGIARALSALKQFQDEDCFAKASLVRRNFADWVHQVGALRRCSLVGYRANVEALPIANVLIDGMLSEELSFVLSRVFGVVTRPGLHCAPLAHKHLGTSPFGTVRFSFGPKTEPAEMAYAFEALKKIAES